MEHVAVVGGAGYIGSHTNKWLAERGKATVVIDNLSRGHREHCRWGELAEVDLADTDRLREVFRRFHVASVLHFAAFAYVGESVADPEKYYLNNVSGTLSLLRAMREAGVRDIVFSSTCATYGTPQRLPITEDHPQNPINPYGATKKMVETILADYAHAYGLRYTALRYFNAAGAAADGEIGEWHDPEPHLIPKVLDVALGLAPNLEVFGDDYDTADGTAVRDYIHVTDLAQAHGLALDHLGKGGESGAFNLGNGAGYSVRQVVSAAERVTGKTIPVVLGPRRPGDPAVLIGSADKAKSVLGWAPRFADLDTIVETAWRWHLRLKMQHSETR